MKTSASYFETVGALKAKVVPAHRKAAKQGTWFLSAIYNLFLYNMYLYICLCICINVYVYIYILYRYDCYGEELISEARSFFRVDIGKVVLNCQDAY